MNSNTNKSGRGIRIFAGIMFLLYCSLYFAVEMRNLIFYDSCIFFPLHLRNFPYIFEFFSSVIAGIAILINKKYFPAFLPVGGIFLAKTVNLIHNFLHTNFAYLGEDIYVLNALLRNIVCLFFVAIVFLFSLMSLRNKRSSFLKMWFIPLIFSIILYLGYLSDSFLWFVVYDANINIPNVLWELVWLTEAFFFCFGLTFYCISLSRGATYTPVSANQQAQRSTPVQSYQPPVYVSPVYPETGQSYPIDDTGELRKYKTMLDEGLISPQDYEKKKNEILNL